jgi:hypothetical protein
MASNLPTTKEPLIDQRGGIGAPWYRFLARIERLLSGATTVTGTGLTTTTAGAITIADNGVSDAMLRDSLAVSVVGRPLNSDGDPQDIVAAADGRVLQRDGDEVVFGYLRLADFTVATVPSPVSNVRRVIYVSDESGGATIAFSNGVNWVRATDLAPIS